ncbi:MAG TPA: hypothetical protein VG737_03375 [Cyclobacteriaceae bacterium]|nr:hypothetical protein [Cyclobacteriaceae bacterium]
MRLFFAIMLTGAVLAAAPTDAQTKTDKFREVTILNRDESSFKAWIDLEQFLQKSQLTSRDSVFRRAALRSIYSVQADTNVYFIKLVRNRRDSIAVVSRAIEGKVSTYTPPLESGIEALFLEKDGATYEMLQKVIVKDDKKFYKDEFRGFLQVFFADCPNISKAMIDKVPFSDLKIMGLVSKYNKACGFENSNKVVNYKAKFQVGLQVEALKYNSTKGIYLNYFEGDRPASGFGFGLYGRFDFPRKKTAFLISELTYSHISGGGNITYWVNAPVYQEITEHHTFNISELRNSYSAYFHLVRFKKSTLAAGGGIMFQLQLQNSSTVTDRGTTTPSAKPSDKFGFSPVANVLYNMNRFGLGYQMIFLATQLKGEEGLHIEHKLFLQFKLSNKQ